jgi:hypothetical protein
VLCESFRQSGTAARDHDDGSAAGRDAQHRVARVPVRLTPGPFAVGCLADRLDDPRPLGVIPGHAFIISPGTGTGRA